MTGRWAIALATTWQLTHQSRCCPQIKPVFLNFATAVRLGNLLAANHVLACPWGVCDVANYPPANLRCEQLIKGVVKALHDHLLG